MKKRTGILMLTGMLVMGMNTMPVLAADETATVPSVASNLSNQNAEITFTKNLEFAEGITVPDAEFDFTITGTEGAPEAMIDKVNYSATDEKGELENGKYIISKNAAISFGEFTKAGVYEYEVKETQENISGVTYSVETYKLRVYVANGNNGGFYVKTITAEKDGEEGNKQSQIVFTNKYVKDVDLVISKNTVGEQADKTKDFGFTITFIKSATADENETSYTGMIGEKSIECAIGQETTFKLHDGQSIEFKNLPAGTRYVVKENEESDNYTPAIRVIENGVETLDKDGQDGVDLSSETDNGNNLVGENENKVVFTNTYKDIPVTGIIISKLPIIFMLGAAFVMMVMVLTMGKKKK